MAPPKAAAEDHQLFARDHSLRAIVLRTSRFFAAEDDSRVMREAYTDASSRGKALLYRRVDIEDVVGAHLAAAERAASVGFAKCIISAATQFWHD